MVSFNPELKSCSFCESSTPNEIMKIDNKQYVLCDNCYNIIRCVIKETLKEQKQK